MKLPLILYSFAASAFKISVNVKLNSHIALYSVLVTAESD